MAKSIVETTVEVYSSKDWKFRVETNIWFQMETTILVYSPKDGKFIVETTERSEDFCVGYMNFLKKRLKLGEKQEEGGV